MKNLKHILLSIIIFGLCQGLAYADNDQTDGSTTADAADGGILKFNQVEGGAEEVVYKDGYNRVAEEDQGTIGKLLENPAAKANYDKCVEYRKSTNSNRMDMGKCIWEGKKDATGRVIVPELTVDARKAVTDMLQAGDGSGKKKGGYDGINLGNVRSSKDPAIQKLEAFFGERLREHLYPEAVDPNTGKMKKQVLMNHTIFNKLYKSQLAKNIIRSVTSYCLDVSSYDNYFVKDDAAKIKIVRKRNIESLGSTSTDAQGKQVNAGFQAWSGCMLAIQKICHKTSKKPSKCVDPVNPNGAKVTCTDLSAEDSQIRSCEVVTSIKTIRKNLLALDKLDKKWEDLDKRSTGSNTFRGNPTPENIKVDTLTNISSNEFVNKSDYGTEVEKLKAEAEECAKPGKVTSQECEKFVNKKGEETQKTLDEMALRTMAMQNKIKDNLSGASSKDELNNYLEEEGYSKDQIEKMMSDPTLTVAKLKTMITDRYKEEREALRLSLNKKLNASQVDVTLVKDGAKQDVLLGSKINKIKDQLTDRVENYKELIYFNNMVSGYLNFSDGSGKVVGTNSRAMFYELDDSAMGASGSRGPSQAGGTPPAAGSGIDYKAIQQQAEQNVARSKEDEGKAQETGIDVETINDKFLKYE